MVGTRARGAVGFVALVLLAVLVTPARTANAGALSAPGGKDRSTVDLRNLEKEVAQSINDIRTDPSGAKAELEGVAARATAANPGQPSVFGASVLITLPEDGAFPVYRSFLDSAIAQAGSTPPRRALVWADGLHQTALDYANLNPTGHFDDGTVATRADRKGFAASTTGVGEGISYNGPSGASQAYNLYIDSGVAGVGHRMAIINPDYTHIGVGCFYKNRVDDITCVVNYAVNWIEKSDSAVFEYGRTYALRDPNNPATFSYVSLQSQSDGGAVFAQCPDGSGTHPLTPTLYGVVTSVDTAVAGGLTARNAACSLPPGTLANGTTLPSTPFSGGLTLNASTPRWQPPPAPEPIQVGKTYAVIEKPGSGQFRYFVYQGLDTRGRHVAAVCPLGTGTTTSTSIKFLVPADTAVADGLQATNQPCGTEATAASSTAPVTGTGAAPSTSSTSSTLSTLSSELSPSGPAPASARGPLVVGQEYAFRNNPRPGQFTTWIYAGPDGSDAKLEFCPERGRIGWANNPDLELTSPEIAVAEGLVVQNKACGTLPTTLVPQIGTTYALRDLPAVGQFYYVTLTSVQGDRYTVTICGRSGLASGFSASRLVTAAVAQNYWGLRANNTSCGTVG